MSLKNMGQSRGSLPAPDNYTEKFLGQLFLRLSASFRALPIKTLTIIIQVSRKKCAAPFFTVSPGESSATVNPFLKFWRGNVVYDFKQLNLLSARVRVTFVRLRTCRRKTLRRDSAFTEISQILKARSLALHFPLCIRFKTSVMKWTCE